MTYSLPSGTVLKGAAYVYTIKQVLGQGSFGITYLATTNIEVQGALGTFTTTINVAIKEFFMRDINGREASTVTCSNSNGLYDHYRKKFQREAENLSKLNHPHIVRVLESFETNNTCYYAMEYCEGNSLDALIESKGRLSESIALYYFTQISKALQFMHDNKMLHLDMKPSNVMLNKNNDAVIIDFGLSKQYDENNEPESSTTIGGGTPGYAPLEQANYQEGKDLPVTMDVYALGGTLFKMLTGKRPPLAAVVLEDGLPIDKLKTLGVSQHTIDCLVKAMSVTKKQRYQSVAEFVRELRGEETVIDTVDVDEKTEIDLNSNSPFNKKSVSGGGAAGGGYSNGGAVTIDKRDVKPQKSKRGVKPILLGVIAAIIAVIIIISFLPEEHYVENNLENPEVPTVQTDWGSDSVAVTSNSAKEVEAEEMTQLYVESKPTGARVYVDGKYIGKTPIKGKEYEAYTSHKIELKLEGYKSYSVSYAFGLSPTVVNHIFERNVEDRSQDVPTTVNETEVINGFKVNWSSRATSSQKSELRKLIHNMVKVSGGSFLMGSNEAEEERPVHRVTVSGFSINRYEVTQREWKAVMGSNPSKVKGDDLPVENISWDNCQTFISKLNALTGLKFRLPTEAEWEFAARGGNNSNNYMYSGSNDLNSVAWSDKNSGSKTHPVGKKQANELGLYDMTGNVLEWCNDWYGSNYYSVSPVNNPKGPSTGEFKVLRGASFWVGSYRISKRVVEYKPSYGAITFGMRLAI